MNKILIYFLSFTILATLAIAAYYKPKQYTVEPIKVGIIQSLTGIYGPQRIPIVEATLLAIDEINQAGGLLGRPVKAVIIDAQSVDENYGIAAQRLITQDKVSVIISNVQSEVRTLIKKIVEKHNHLFLFTRSYEGFETSPNIVYFGLTPNQQIFPGIQWCINNLGKTFYLLGSDNLYSNISHHLMRDHIASLKATTVGESLLKIGETNMKPVIEGIKKANPEVILHTISDIQTNKAFFQALADAGINPEDIPVMTFTLSEIDVRLINPTLVQSNYITTSYIQSEEKASKVNSNFINSFKRKYGQNKAVGQPMEINYVAIKLWALAVNKAGTADPAIIKNKIVGESIYAPEGVIYIGEDNRHAWRAINIGRIQNTGQIIDLWDSKVPIPPLPCLTYRKEQEWQQLIQKFYKSEVTNEQIPCL